MPGRKKKKVQKGAGVLKFVKQANQFVKKHKLISNTAKALDFVGVPHASKIARVASSVGYGQKGGKKKIGKRLKFPSS